MPQHPSTAVRGTSTHQKQFAAGYANATSLTAQTGKPNHAAQAVDFYNGGTAEQNAVYVTFDGETVTKPIAPGATYPAMNVVTLNTSGANVSAVAYWWMLLGATIN